MKKNQDEKTVIVGNVTMKYTKSIELKSDLKGGSSLLVQVDRLYALPARKKKNLGVKTKVGAFLAKEKLIERIELKSELKKGCPLLVAEEASIAILARMSKKTRLEDTAINAVMKSSEQECLSLERQRNTALDFVLAGSHYVKDIKITVSPARIKKSHNGDTKIQKDLALFEKGLWKNRNPNPMIGSKELVEVELGL